MADRGQEQGPSVAAVFAQLLDESAEDLYENAPCGYFSSRPDGTIVKVNATFLAWTGYEREDLVGRKRLHDLLPPGDRIFYETHYAPLLHMQGTVREIAVEIVCADGRRIPALINTILKRDEAGLPLLSRTTVFDATDRRRYERELVRAREEAESRARAAVALAHVADGVVLVDAAGRVALLNAAAEAILGVEADRVTGRPLDDVVAGWREIAPRIPVGRVDRWPQPATLPLVGGGREQWLRVAGVDAGEGVVYTIRDITADRRLEEIRNELVAIVSHEVRTPLAGAYGAAQTLLQLQDALTSDQRRELLQVIVDQSERLTRIVDQVHLASRIDTGELGIVETGFDAAALAARVADRQRGSRVTVDAPEPVHVRADAARTEEILSALLDNALKYSPPGSGVRVAVERRERSGTITVSDDGPGIPPAERERVFEKFYRLDPDLQGGVGGAGLGLYIAKELAGRMGGRIGVEPSVTGAVFALELPLADAAPGR